MFCLWRIPLLDTELLLKMDGLTTGIKTHFDSLLSGEWAFGQLLGLGTRFCSQSREPEAQSLVLEPLLMSEGKNRSWLGKT